MVARRKEVNQAELDAAIEQANRIFSRGYVQVSPPECPRDERAGTPGLLVNVAAGDGWPLEFQRAEERFAQPHAKLFPLLGRKVRTPAGPGTLLQVFVERVTVLLDSEITKCSCFPPDQIQLASGE
jgi:hypothetical protein